MSDDLVHGRYRILRPLGAGGAGTTWRARDEATGRDVTVKRLNTPLSGPIEALLDREARLLAQLDHPQIPAFVDAFIEEFRMQRYLHVVLAFVEGEPLSELLARRRFDQGEVRALVDDLLTVVAWLHRLAPPVVHRDIKPSNIIVRPDGRVALIDFGLATDALDRTFLHTMAVGTLGYQAPEQISGDPGPASDVYSVGALALELLTRESPRALLSGQTLRWQGRVHHLDARWQAWLARSLAVDPAARFRDGAEALAALRASDEVGEPVRRPRQVAPALAPAPTSATPPEGRSANPLIFPVATVLFLLVAAGPAFVLGLALLEPCSGAGGSTASTTAAPERGSWEEIGTLSNSELARRCLTGEVVYCASGGNRLTTSGTRESDWALARSLWRKGCELRDVRSCASIASLTVDSWEASGPYWSARACALGDDVNCFRAIVALERPEGINYRSGAVAELEPGCDQVDGEATDVRACAVAVWAREWVLGDPNGARELQQRACGDARRCLDAERLRLGIEAR